MKPLEKQSFSILSQNRSLNKKSPIAVFDSGIGGLTVAKKLHQLMPGEKIIYFGDTARVPYGTKSATVIKQYALQICNFLVQFNPKIIVIACHSVSSIGTLFLKKKFKDFVFFDVIQPSAQQAAKLTKNKKIGVIGTPATISSMMYSMIFKKIDKDISVFQKACPLLVPLVEEGWANTDVAKIIVKHYIEELLEKKIDTLILGCTHYPLLKNTIKKVTDDCVHLIDASDATSMQVEKFLVENRLLNSKKKKTPVLYFSDLPEYRKQIMRNFWQDTVYKIKKVAIERS